jgi:alkanesulfonate monooxygenase SsuD/methylene tetrahydromethanopterin reductase-like flavin-dependent oxidoreductase (luciferase family)
VRFEPDWPPEDLRAFARWAEQAGYDELWFSEDLPWAGAIAMAATALASTTRLAVGLGLLPAATRNITTAAMEIAALSRIAPGRLLVGFGHGVPAWMEQIGAGTPARLAVLEETVAGVARLLTGEELQFSGEHTRVRGVQLGHPPAEIPPLLIGTTGPSGLALAGRVADGIVLPELSSPAAVRWARAQMGASGRVGITVVFGMVSIDDDPARALAQTRARLQRIIEFQIYPRLTEIAGLGADGGGELDDHTLRSVAVAGTPADGAKTVADWAAAGADSVVIVAGADEPRRSYERFAAEVVPLIGNYVVE